MTETITPILEELRAVNRKLHEYRGSTQTLSEQRRALIVRARDLGATFQQIADCIGVKHAATVQKLDNLALRVGATGPAAVRVDRAWVDGCQNRYLFL